MWTIEVICHKSMVALRAQGIATSQVFHIFLHIGPAQRALDHVLSTTGTSRMALFTVLLVFSPLADVFLNCSALSSQGHWTFVADYLNGSHTDPQPYMLENDLELFHHKCFTTFCTLSPESMSPPLLLTECPSQASFKSLQEKKQAACKQGNTK